MERPEVDERGLTINARASLVRGYWAIEVEDSILSAAEEGGWLEDSE